MNRDELIFPQPLFNTFVQRAGCGSRNLGEKMACLRSASVSALAIAQDNATATLYVLNRCLHVPRDDLMC